MHPAELDAAARAVLSANDRGGYTVPTEGLYPFQWNWDSAFVAMGFATFDADRALRELERLVEGQWDDGMIPHIVFHAPADSYFPGPEVWGTRHRIPTSGISQPPVMGMALRFVAARAPAAMRPRIATLAHAAARSHAWWRAARDPEGIGLVAVLHPWETGSDNSPAWDAALARVPQDTTTPVRRRDTGHVDAAMRPRDEDYRRYIHLLDTYRAAGWQPAAMWRAAPFRIAEVQVSAILCRAAQDLSSVFDELGEPGAAAAQRALATHLAHGLDAAWRPALSRFVSRDLVAGEDIAAPTQAGFLPLLALDLDAPRRKAVLAEMRRWSAGCVLGLPTTPPYHPAFDAKRYWRGPVWAVVDWLLAEGLRRNGEAEAAQALIAPLLAAIARAGFDEYFDPLTGEGLGGRRFSWTAAAWLVLSRDGAAERAETPAAA
ncbi:neutral trehalase [Falsiroseomonas bella]|uniref:Neutral trehalase n=1 Tax=Falsiroseomonas bella TaxID=2184016 RepID=A0A317FK86_9PROT|nr:neutral trehalase [Falsiroseomonas bella]PWS38058.1 neutral trehalase [Falsiroseomonas bella]